MAENREAGIQGVPASVPLPPARLERLLHSHPQFTRLRVEAELAEAAESTVHFDLQCPVGELRFETGTEIPAGFIEGDLPYVFGRQVIRLSILPKPSIRREDQAVLAGCRYAGPEFARTLMDRVKGAVGRLLWALYESDGAHVLEWHTDGDGHNEPYSQRYRCSCGHVLAEWAQPDPECTGMPDQLDQLLAWDAHCERLDDEQASAG